MKDDIIQKRSINNNSKVLKIPENNILKYHTEYKQFLKFCKNLGVIVYEDSFFKFSSRDYFESKEIKDEIFQSNLINMICNRHLLNYDTI